MNCEAFEIMSKDEQYARGWLLLHGHENTSTVLSMAKYAVNLCKLKREHQLECWICSQNASGEDLTTRDFKATCANSESR